jgi:molybdopterin converting factor small subunit
VATIQVLFFGATAEIARTRTLDLTIAKDLTSDLLLKKMVEQFPALASHRLHLSINQQYAPGDQIILEGDEIAVFTAVSGG